MTSVTIEIPDLPLIKDAFKRAPERMRAEMAKAYQFGAMLTQRIEKQEAPIDRGYLRGSIDTRVTENSATIWPRANYAINVYQGTGIYGPNHSRIYPKNGKVLAWKANGKTIFARSIAGQKPNKFVDRTVERARPEVVAAFEAAVDNTLRT